MGVVGGVTMQTGVDTRVGRIGAKATEAAPSGFIGVGGGVEDILLDNPLKLIVLK